MPFPFCLYELLGRGALTRWFVLASSQSDKKKGVAIGSTKYVLIDKEKRRNKAEGKDETLAIGKLSH